MFVSRKSNFLLLQLVVAILVFQTGCATRAGNISESGAVEIRDVVEVGEVASEQNLVEEYMTVAGTLKLVGANLDRQYGRLS
ncbi:MAG: hypothetical protein AAFR81_30315 [Chloroflexota bacterium]